MFTDVRERMLVTGQEDVHERVHGVLCGKGKTVPKFDQNYTCNLLLLFDLTEGVDTTGRLRRNSFWNRTANFRFYMARVVFGLSFYRLTSKTFRVKLCASLSA